MQISLYMFTSHVINTTAFAVSVYRICDHVNDIVYIFVYIKRQTIDQLAGFVLMYTCIRTNCVLPLHGSA